MRSLQRTLAFRYGLTMLVALGGIALWAFLGVRRTIDRQLDLALQDAAGLMVDVVARGEGLALHGGSSDLGRFLDEVNRFVVTRDSAGRILDYNMPLANILPLDTAAFAAALGGRRAWGENTFAGGRTRSVYVPGPRVSPGGGPAAPVVQVAASMRPLQAASDSVLLRMLGTALIGALLTGLGAGWLARSSLTPVAEIAAQARSITSRGGLPRITVHADVIELRSLIEVLNGMLARLERALSAQRRIIRDVGHELRTPITAIRGEVEVALHRERRPEEYRALLGSILEEVDRLALMGDQLIFLTRFEAGDVELQRESVDLAELMRGVVRQAARRLGGHVVRFGDLPAGIGCEADPRLLSLALEQLLDNVARHTPAGTELRLGIASEADRVTIAVEDAGPGVPEESLAELFAPFFLTDAARTRARAGGVGLGLAVVAAIAELHGGEVAASRSPFGGLRVVLALPGAPWSGSGA